MRTDFLRATGPDPHTLRARAIVARHPEVRALYGRNPWTAAVTLGIVALQTGMAAAVGLSGAPWWVAVLAAALVGAFANHALYVAIHDATHELIFRSTTLNRLVLLLADLPNVAPGAMGFRGYHLQHHSGRSRYNGDPDLPNAWEARLVRNVWWRKIVWMAAFPFLQLTRVPRVEREPLLDRWSLANYGCNALYLAATVALFGPMAALYLFTSFMLATGLHPLGVRWISEHYTHDVEQDTVSYYGPINAVALNIGYHNEHHDFPRVPWNRLPAVRKAAPDFYDTLFFHTSWTRLFVSFLFDTRHSLFDRVVRPPLAREPAKASVKAQPQPTLAEPVA